MVELSVQLRPSMQLVVFLVASHLLAALAVWFSALPWWLCLLVDVAVLADLLWSLRQHYRLGRRQLRYVDGRWWLADHRGEESLELIGEYLVTPWLLVLRFKRSAGSATLVLPPDSAATDDLRRLRVLLRFGLGGKEVA
ncbi:MAG: protein YgfX [Cellvibrionaceae bacterium]